MLIEHYLPMVKQQCIWFHDRLPAEVELDDVVSAGIDGLVGAIKAFDPGMGVQFKTYCMARVRGAILDFLRAIDQAPRLLRQRANHLQRCREELTAELGREPGDDELAAFMGLSSEAFRERAIEVRPATQVSLDCDRHESRSGTTFCGTDILADARASSPLKHPQQQDLKQVLTRGLSTQERQIVLLYYYEEMTMKEIGATLGISESRVSQTHAAVLDWLREKMHGRSDEFALAET